MTKWTDTNKAADFIASGGSRETSPAVMEAIAFFAQDEREAEDIWNGDFPRGLTDLDIWEKATSNGTRDVDLDWGDGGEQWVSDAGIEA